MSDVEEPKAVIEDVILLEDDSTEGQEESDLATQEKAESPMVVPEIKQENADNSMTQADIVLDVPDNEITSLGDGTETKAIESKDGTETNAEKSKDVKATEPDGVNEKSSEAGEKKGTCADTKRDDESENFKVELAGLPKYYPIGQLKKLVNDVLQLDCHKMKSGGILKNLVYLNFKNEEARFKAITILNGYKWLKCTFAAQPADPAKDAVSMAKIDFLKLGSEDDDLPLEERITKAVTPYHNKSYEDQLDSKERAAFSMLRKYGNELANLNDELKEFVKFHKIRRKGQVCEMDKIVPSPIREGYRNKCEFTIGKSGDSQKPVVGFRMASYKKGSVEVGPVQHLRHINKKMKDILKSLEAYLETSSYEPFDPFTHSGVWRQLIIRTSNQDDVLLVIEIHPQDLGEEKLKSLKEDIVQYFTEGGGKENAITSIFFQTFGQIESGVEVEYEHVFGKTYIEEKILDKIFRAGPDSFLQVNTPACEELYKKVMEVADVDMTSVVLDICCGVGSIGLAAAETAYKVLGVDITESSIEYARINAKNNQISNSVFYHGKAEDYIEKMIVRAEKNTTIAIVDPPRAGLHGSVMNALRKCDYLDRLVYISCDPQAALPNFEALGRPRSKAYKGSFFVPIRATPVDLFPDTPHFELIIVFERYDECKWRRIMDGNPRPKDQEYFSRIPPLDEKILEKKAKREKERWERRKKERSDQRSIAYKAARERRLQDENYRREYRGDRDSHGNRDGGYGRNRNYGNTDGWNQEEGDGRRNRGWSRGESNQDWNQDGNNRENQGGSNNRENQGGSNNKEWNQEENNRNSGWKQEGNNANRSGWNQQGNNMNNSGWNQGGNNSGWSQEGGNSGWNQSGNNSGWNQSGSNSGWTQGGNNSGWNQEGNNSGWSQGENNSGWNPEGSNSGWNQSGSSNSGWNQSGNTSGWNQVSTSNSGWDQSQNQGYGMYGNNMGTYPDGTANTGWNQNGNYGNNYASGAGWVQGQSAGGNQNWGNSQAATGEPSNKKMKTDDNSSSGTPAVNYGYDY